MQFWSITLVRYFTINVLKMLWKIQQAWKIEIIEYNICLLHRCVKLNIWCAWISTYCPASWPDIIFWSQTPVLGVTHDQGHTLDLVITRSTEDIVSNFEINDPALSDQNAVHFKLSIDKSSFIRSEIVYRKWKSVDSTGFSAGICQSSLHTSSAHNITDLVKQYNMVLGDLADKHAPLITRTVTVRPRAHGTQAK